MRQSDALSVLAIGAHPDDCELLCGGAMALFAARGARVVLCSVARGDKGHRRISPEELAEQRSAEAAAAAAVIGAEAKCLQVPDGHVFRTPVLRARIIELIRTVQPQLLLTHWPGDYHPDHQCAGELVTEASWLAASPGHVTDSPPLDSPTPLYYLDTLAGLSFEPTEYVDISGVWDKKERMLSCHRSQAGPDAQHGEADLVRLARDQAALRGHQCGVRYAEAFRPCLKWKRVRPYRLLP